MTDRVLRNRWLAANILPHEAWIRRVVTRQVHAAGLDVDDVVQETYSVLARLPNIDAISQPRAYALQVARSLVLQHVRRAKIVPIESLYQHEGRDFAADYPAPDQQAFGRIELQRVMDAIEAMPPPVRLAFWMRRVEGVPQREIAERLNLSINTVEKQISRGINILVAKFVRDGDMASRASSDDETKNKNRKLDEQARNGSDD